jgi:molybdopterin synthase catalytic subunit
MSPADADLAPKVPPERARLHHAPLSIEAVTALVARPGAGAIDLFVGVVRDHAEGRAVSSLEYSAYESMAQKELARIVAEVEAKVEGARCAVHHRLGLLAVGELAIVCAASTPHRAESFAACRLLIEEIKHRVPIWKRERGPDGEAWVGWVDARCGIVGHGHEGHGHEGHGHEGHGHEGHGHGHG